MYGKRVQEQLQGRPHGMFSTQVEKVYQKKYGEYYDLVVSHVVSPSLFYVQSHSTLPGYTALNSQMTRYYENNIKYFDSKNITLKLVSSYNRKGSSLIS